MSPHDDPTPRIFYWLTPALRRTIYTVALAVLPLLSYYGILTEAVAPLWASLIGSILVPGIALAHTPGNPLDGGHERKTH